MSPKRQRPQYNYRRPVQTSNTPQNSSFAYIAFGVFVCLLIALPLFFRPKGSSSEETFLSASQKTSDLSKQQAKPKKNPEDLRLAISEVLGENSGKYGIYIKDLNSGQVISLNEDQTLPPASIYKVPLAMLVLKDVDKGTRRLEDTIILKHKNKAYDTDSMYYLADDTKYSLKTYLNYLLVNSDNTAMNTLEELLGGNDIINQRLKSELGVTTFFRDPHQATAKEIGNIFEKIYKQSYLSKESNDLLLDLLKHTGGWLQDRIPAGLEDYDNVTVAHKVGNILTENGAAYADAGIVFGENTDYIIIVINEDVLEADAREKIPQISKITYEWLNN